jgi:hypothetical protein
MTSLHLPIIANVWYEKEKLIFLELNNISQSNVIKNYHEMESYS